MKLSPETVEVLKNFSVINQSILVKPGNVLNTISPIRTVLAKAEVDEKFTTEFAIYDLNKFLAKLSLYKECDLQFDSDKVNFCSLDGKRKDYIKFCSPGVIVTPPDKVLSIGTPDYSFELSKSDIDWQKKSAGISGSPYFVFKSDGKKISFVSTDVDDNSSDYSSTEIADGDGSKFEVVVKVDYFKILDGSYNVEISKKGLSKFTHTERKVEYFIAVESAKSKFD